MKDSEFKNIIQFIERCESGEIRYFVQDKIDQYKNYFQYVNDLDENDPDLLEIYPPQKVNFSSGLPEGFSKDKVVRIKLTNLT